MPNWCVNEVVLQGTKEQLDFLLAGEGFSFNNVLPEPKELEGIHCGGAVDLRTGERVSVWREGPGGEILGLSAEEMNSLIAEYGATNWYAWHCNNWGVKWDACDAIVSDPIRGENPDEDDPDQRNYTHTLRLVFETSWGHPEPIVEALGKQLEHVEWVYREMGMAFQGGEVWHRGERLAQWRCDYTGRLGG